VVKQDYLNRINELKDKITPWSISLEVCSKAGFVMGYFRNLETGKYDVYINNERGRQHIRLSTNDELEALGKLLSMIEFEIESKRRVRI